MNSKERISNILKHQPVDRIGLYEHFWDDTYAAYVAKGKIKEGEILNEHFNLDIIGASCSNCTIDMDFEPEVVREDNDTITIKDGNGAILRRHKHHDTTPEHVDFTIKEYEDWKKFKHKLQENLERRVNYTGYRETKAQAKRDERFFICAGAGVFEHMHLVCGHENMLAGMALDPDWIRDMAETYTELMITTQEMLFEKEGLPDGMFFYEDLGFKDKPFMSPKMFREILQPSLAKIIDHAHSKDLPFILHSCGFVEPLLPDMIDAGIDCLQVIEIKAGMDLLRIHKQFGDKIALMGGIDVRALYTNDRSIIDKELESKIPIVKQGYGYVAHSDHSIPNTVEYDTLRYYMDRVLELGSY